MLLHQQTLKSEAGISSRKNWRQFGEHPTEMGRPLQTSGDNWGMTKAESGSPPEGGGRGVVGLAGAGSFPSRKGAGPPPSWAREPHFQMTALRYRKQRRHTAIRRAWLCVHKLKRPASGPGEAGLF